jgi:hypothetical protein
MHSCQNLSIENRVEINKDEDWLFIGGDIAKTNISKSDFDLEPPFELYWQYDVDGGLSKNCLAVSDAILFVNTLNGEFFAIDVTSGKSLGRTSTIGKSSFSTPVILGNNVIIASSGDTKSKVFNYNLVTGMVKWEKKIGWVESSPFPMATMLFSAQWTVLFIILTVLRVDSTGLPDMLTRKKDMDHFIPVLQLQEILSLPVILIIICTHLILSPEKRCGVLKQVIQ